LLRKNKTQIQDTFAITECLSRRLEMSIAIKCEILSSNTNIAAVPGLQLQADVRQR